MTKENVRVSSVATQYMPVGKVARDYYLSDDPVQLLMGAVGSGKTTTSLAKLRRFIRSYPADKNGVRYTRILIVRESIKKVRESVFIDYKKAFPEHIYGGRYKGENDNSSIEHTIEFIDKDSFTGEETIVRSDIIFTGVSNTQEDSANAFMQLASQNYTLVYISEAKFQEFDVIAQLYQRAGRTANMSDYEGLAPEFPKVRMIMDSNPPSESHWIHDYFVKEQYKVNKATKKINENAPKWTLFQQPSQLSMSAENCSDTHPKKVGLPRSYWEDMCYSLAPSEVRTRVHGEFGWEQSGGAVFSEYYDDDIHCLKTEPTEPPDSLVWAGLDFGLTPACVFVRKYSGVYYVFHELITKEGVHESSVEFVRRFDTTLTELGLTRDDVVIFCDPAGNQRSQTDLKTPIAIFQQAGYKIHSAFSNSFEIRFEAVVSLLNRNGKYPMSLRVSPKCRTIRDGFLHGYKYKDKVNFSFMKSRNILKNYYSHVHDALQYCALGILKHDPVAQANSVFKNKGISSSVVSCFKTVFNNLSASYD